MIAAAIRTEVNRHLAALYLAERVFGSFGYLRFVKDANIFEMSLFRLFMALAGALVAFLEDVMTRGLIMNELQRLARRIVCRCLPRVSCFLYITRFGDST